MAGEGANTVNLSAVIEFIAKLNEDSLNKVVQQISKTPITTGESAPSQATVAPSGGGGGEAPASEKSGGLGSLFKMFGGGMGGGAAGAEGAAGAGGAAGGAGMAAMGPMAIVAGGMKIVEKIFGVLQELFKLIMDSSPLFQSVAKLFQTSMKLLFMPLGNMIAKVLMPIMMKYLQKSAERAQKYANAGPEDLAEATTGAITDMIAALAEVMGVVFLKVMPPLIEGLVVGIVEGIKEALPGVSGDSERYKSVMSKYQEEYDNKFKSMGGNLLNSISGYSDGIDRFGLVLYTANNKIGRVMSESATVFYKGVETIEGGFTEASEVVIYGTNGMITQMNEKFNLMSAGVVSTVDTTTGQVITFGQALEDVLAPLGGAYNQVMDFSGSTLPSLITSLSDVGGGLNSLAATIANVIDSISNMLREESEQASGSSIKERKPTKFGLETVKYSWKRDGGSATHKNYNSEDAQRLFGINEDVTVWKFGGAYAIVSASTGKTLEEGYYDKGKAKENQKRFALATSGLGLLGGVAGYISAQKDVETADRESAKIIAGENFAQGGIVSSQKDAIIGEQGPEAVVPVDPNLLNMMGKDGILQRLKSALSFNGSQFSNNLGTVGGQFSTNYSGSTNIIGSNPTYNTDSKQTTIGKAPINVNLEINGNVYGVDDIKSAVNQAMTEVSYSMRGAY